MSRHQEDMSAEEQYEIAEKIDEFMKELFEIRSEVIEFFMGKEIDMATAIIAMRTLSVDCTESLMNNRDGEHIDEHIDKIMDDKVDMFFQMKPLYEDYEKSGDIH
jgi:hypothetical protein|tara:strand:+ start:239 stop:553 length:315 start_codon:yes stop_codon:yes gene_type:complete